MKQRVMAFGGVWLMAAAAWGASGMTARLHPPLPQAIVLALTLLLLLLCGCVRSLREWVMDLPAETYMRLHFLRAAAGAAFLWYYIRGWLPGAFAIPAGWGDIVVAASGALVIRTSTPGRPAWWIWNLFGLADIAFVVVTAALMGSVDPGAMAALLRLPLCLLPLFLVPLIIASHVLLFFRLGRSRAAVRAMPA